MIDPLTMQNLKQNNDLEEKDLVRKSKFGECLSITIQVEGGNGEVFGTHQSLIGGMTGLMASIDHEIEMNEECS